MKSLNNIIGIDLTNYQKDDWINTLSECFPNLKSIKSDSTNIDHVDWLHNFPSLEEFSCKRNNIDKLIDDKEKILKNEMKSLNLSKNNVSKSSLEHFLETLSLLESIDLSENNLDEMTYALTLQRNLIVMNLSKNNLVELGDDFFDHFIQLRYLNLSHNKLKFVNLYKPNMRGMVNLNISFNKFNEFPANYFLYLDTLTHLNLSNMDLGLKFGHENLSKTLECLKDLVDLDMSHNELEKIPDSIYEMKKLKRFVFTNNKVQNISRKIGKLQCLTTLNFSRNCLVGLPASLTNLSNLKSLYLNSNKLSEITIPDTMHKLQNLETFMCSFNNLETIPASLCKCKKLKTLFINDNRLHTLPDAIYNLKNLTNFDKKNNENLVMPPKPQRNDDEFSEMDFSYSNIKNIFINLLKQKFRLEAEEKERIRIQQEKDQVVTGQAKEEEEIQRIIDAESKKARMISQGGNETVFNETSDIPPPPPPSPPKFIETSLAQDDYLDLTSIFTENIATDLGLFKFQIESFHPTLISDISEYGTFYSGDCYIVMNAFKNENDVVQKKVYTWIGNDSPLEKKACVAMHAVNLRNFVQSSEKIDRIEQDQESEEFLQLFCKNISVIQGEGTLTSLNKAEKIIQTPKLYQFFSKEDGSVGAEAIPLLKEMLKSEHIYALDDNCKIYIWSGKQTKLIYRNKIRLFVEKQLKHDKKGKGEIIMINETDQKSEEFIDLFHKYKDSYENYTLNLASFCKREVLIRVHIKQQRVFLKQVYSRKKKLEPTMLKTNEIYILDCYIDMFLWMGKLADQSDRECAHKAAIAFQNAVVRPPGFRLIMVYEGVEPFLFKSKFSLWNDVMTINYTMSAEYVMKKERENNKKKENKGETKQKLLTHADFNLPKIDVDPMFLPRSSIRDPQLCLEEIDEIRNRLSDIKSFVLENGKYVNLAPHEIGHFYSGAVYVFLVTLREFDDEDPSIEYEPSFVVFFWEGKHCSKKGWLLFTFSLQKKFQEAIGNEIEIERMQQQQESVKFLSIFHGKLVYHTGERPSLDISAEQPTSLAKLYQIRAMSDLLTLRCVEIDVDAAYLSTEFSYVLLSTKSENSNDGTAYLWCGKNLSEGFEEISANYANILAANKNLDIVKLFEDEETDDFWENIGGKKDYLKTCTVKNFARLFRCTNDQGYYGIRERMLDFSQDDLLFDDVMMLDSGDIVFVWIGKSASSLEITMTRKLAPVYIEHLAQTKNGIPRKIEYVYMDEEPVAFKRIFHGFS